MPLKIAAVFSPPAEGNPDVRQIQEDLPQEKEDNRHDPEGKKTALKAIIADYNQQYGTNRVINNFDLYYQDIQQRIKDQKFPNRDLPRKGGEKIDITIVVDMLLTGFDARVPQHALRRQEPQAPRPDPGLLPHQPRPQRDQALRPHHRLPPAARQRRRRHRALLRCAR